MSRFITYLPRECVEHLPTTRMRIAHSGRIGSTWRLPGALRKTSENNIFKPNKPKKTQNVWRDIVRPSRCNAFATARFQVFLLNFVTHKSFQSQYFSHGKEFYVWRALHFHKLHHVTSIFLQHLFDLYKHQT